MYGLHCSLVSADDAAVVVGGIDGPPPELRFRRACDLPLFARQLWRARELTRTLVERDLRARYKQAFLGAAWAFIGPLGFVLVFSVFFNRVAKIDTQGIPYVLFSYVGLIPWGFFSAAVGSAANSLLANVSLINKVACPREVFPIAAVVTAVIDSVITSLALPILFIASGRAPKVTVYWLPIVLIVQVAFTLGLSLLLASVLMFVRDVRHGLPLLLQLLLFATPVAYGLNSVPKNLRGLYSFLNPIGPVIDSYRRAILFGLAPRWTLLGLGGLMSVLMLVVGYAVFKRLEPGFSDVG